MSFLYSGLDHVQLAAPEGCEEEARAFYAGLLGWTEIPKPASLAARGGVWFQCGSHQVHIGVQKGFAPATKAHPAFGVSGLAALKEHVKRGGGVVIEDDARVDEGVSRFYMNDPFGNRLEFLEWTAIDSKERFSDRVDTYVKYRPSYPEEALDYLYRVVGLQRSAWEIADVGAGTGKFSELLLARGSRVVAVEPNGAMREAALGKLGGAVNYRAVPGSAEATGLPDHSIDFVVCAQSFHWFDRPAAQAEFRRILKPGGRAALIWNSRLTQGTAFREQYDKLLREFGTDYDKVQHKNITPDSLRRFFKDGAMTEARFPYGQRFDFEGLKGRLLSSSYAPAPGHPNHEPMMAELKRIFDENAEDGEVAFDYETEVFWGEV